MIYTVLMWVWRVIQIVDFAILTLIMYGLTFLPKPILDKYYPRFFRFWCQAFVHTLGIELRPHQKHAKPLPERFIMIGNHPSAFEDIGIPALFNVYSLAKIEVRDWFIVGRISWAAGTLYVQRESKESRNAAAQNLIDALESGKNIALYPEGGCKGRRIFESFRYGAFDISLQTGVPIVPVFLHYEAQEDFEWTDPDTLLDKLVHFLTTKNKRANYYVFDPIDPKDFPDKESYCNYAHNLYLEWQKKYLE